MSKVNGSDLTTLNERFEKWWDTIKAYAVPNLYNQSQIDHLEYVAKMAFKEGANVKQELNGKEK